MNNSQNFLDTDTQETQEWIDALASTLEFEGAARTEFILGKMLDKAQEVSVSAITDFFDTKNPIE